MAKANFMLVNQSILPYNLEQDYIRLKLTMMLGKRMSQKNGITGTIYGNVAIGGGDASMATFVTNEYGVAEILIPTNTIPNRTINTCKLWAVGTYLGDTVNSVVARANFIYYPPHETFIITAGSCTQVLTDRSEFNIYNAGDYCSGVYARPIEEIISRSASWL